MSAIEVDHLTKDYGSVVANDDLTFSVEAGEIFGYLGPNGAGKTTTIRTLLGLQSPTDGTARVLGADVRDESALVEARRDVGYLPHDPSFDDGATGREVLDLHGEIKGDARREELLDLFTPPLDRPIREYSAGNVQKLGIVQAAMHDPDLLILDEPTSSLDPLLQQRFNQFLREERETGTAIFLSSHVLSEVRRVCDRVGILRGGELVTVETVESLLNRSGKFVRVRVADDVDPESLVLDRVYDLDVREVDATGEEGIVLECSFTFLGDVNDLLDHLSTYDLLDLHVEEAPLEDVFLRFYGEDTDV